MLVISTQNWSILAKFTQKNPANSAVFYWLLLGEVSPPPRNFPWICPWKSFEIWLFSAKIPQNRPIFLRNLTFLPRKSYEIGRFFHKFWLFSCENPAKILRNRLIFLQICPWKSREILLFFPRSPVEMCRKVISHVHFIWRTINPVRKSSYKGHLRLTVFWNKNNEKCWHSYKSLLPGFLDIWNTTCSLTLYFLLDQEMLGCSEWLNKCFLYRHYLFLFFIQNISPIVIG